MIWNDKEIRTIGDVFDAVCACTTKAEADALMVALREYNEHADENVGYVIGWADDATRERLYGLFDLVHPVYGTAV